ncbi:MAG: AraC family transcriptional regulator [Rubrivivax sp.]|nr:AraC family transcriptional regulator [Pyrinomonadaceae bacterium]
MTPYLNLLAVLNLLGAAQGLLLALALVSVKRGNRFANHILAALIITISIFVTGAVLRTTGYVFTFPHMAWAHDPFPFLAGPLLFLYLRVLTSDKRSLARRDALHFVPAAACALYLMPYYFQSAEAKLAALQIEYTQPTMGQWYYVRSAAVVAHFLAYLVVVMVMLWRFTRRVRRGDAGGDRGALAQVRFLVAACLVIWVAALLRFALDQTARTNLLVPLLISAVVYGLGYMAMREPEPEARAVEKEETPTAPKYERSTLTPERAERYTKKLLQVMETERPYTDGALNLQKLAARLSIPVQHLSQIVNERLNQSFTDFVNAYRVEEAKRKLLDPSLSHYSVLAIAEDVGFNSKSSFNAVFKKHAGMTPTEFRNSATLANGNGTH